MRNLRLEENELTLADRHIADGNERIARLTRLLERQKEAGVDTDRCENLISLMQSVLETFSSHRQLIVQEIERLRQLG